MENKIDKEWEELVNWAAKQVKFYDPEKDYEKPNLYPSSPYPVSVSQGQISLVPQWVSSNWMGDQNHITIFEKMGAKEKPFYTNNSLLHSWDFVQFHGGWWHEKTYYLTPKYYSYEHLVPYSKEVFVDGTHGYIGEYLQGDLDHHIQRARDRNTYSIMPNSKDFYIEGAYVFDFGSGKLYIPEECYQVVLEDMEKKNWKVCGLLVTEIILDFE